MIKVNWSLSRKDNDYFISFTRKTNTGNIYKDISYWTGNSKSVLSKIVTYFLILFKLFRAPLTLIGRGKTV